MNSSHCFNLTDVFFHGFKVIGTAAIFFNNAEYEFNAIRSTFCYCSSDIGTCAMKVSCKNIKLRKICFSHLTTNYISPTGNGGSAVSVTDSVFNMSEISMLNVVHQKPLCHAAALFKAAKGIFSYSNHSFGSMDNGIGHTNSLLLHEGGTFSSSYCCFHHLDGGICINNYGNKLGSCSHMIFEDIKSLTSFIVNPFVDFSIDKCICLNCENIAVDTSAKFKEWYFSGCPSPGPQFTNIVSNIDLFTVTLRKRCDIKNDERTCSDAARRVIFSCFLALR